MMAPDTLIVTLTSAEKDKWEEAYKNGVFRAKEGVQIQDLAFSYIDNSVWMHGFMAGYESIKETH
jgi:hypothetical protein